MEDKYSKQSINTVKPLVQSQPFLNLINNQKGFHQITLGILILLLVAGGGAYYLIIRKDSSSVRVQDRSDITTPSDSSIKTTPSSEQKTLNPLVDTSQWKIYTDNEIGYQISFPESKKEYYKNRLPAKQYLSENLSDGYGLILTDDTIGQGYYFMITIHKKNNNLSLLDYWKKYKEKGSFVFDNCSINECIGHYTQGTGKTYRYEIKDESVSGKNAVKIIDVKENYGTNERAVFTEYLFIDLNPTYYMEINKGSSDIADAILSTLKF
jgi:hypothetical protein